MLRPAGSAVSRWAAHLWGSGREDREGATRRAGLCEQVPRGEGKQNSCHAVTDTCQPPSLTRASLPAGSWFQGSDWGSGPSEAGVLGSRSAEPALAGGARWEADGLEPMRGVVGGQGAPGRAGPADRGGLPVSIAWECPPHGVPFPPPRLTATPPLSHSASTQLCTSLPPAGSPLAPSGLLQTPQDPGAVDTKVGGQPPHLSWQGKG